MNRTLRILLLSNGFFLLAAGLFGPIYAIFVEDIGGDILAAGNAYAAFSISAGLLIFFISRWEDHIKHKEKLVIGGWALSCVGYLGYMFVSTPWHLALVQVVFGIGTAICTPAYDGMYSGNLDKGRFASEWGMWESMYYIITAIASVVGAYIASCFGFSALFAVMFILSLAGLVSSLFLAKR